MQKINWGIIGCGDVTELKSGPAFNKVKDSALVAVMRRDATKAEDYASRHGVPVWYNEAAKLIEDPGVNAIYIATPPDSHEKYTLAAIAAGKPVYVEKPMTLDASSAKVMINAAKSNNVKLVVAHYRRAQPMFRKIKELLDAGTVGEVTHARLDFQARPVPAQDLLLPKIAWRVNPLVSGGGLFHDLAPHQLGLMLFFFGTVRSASGISTNKAGLYAADDNVEGSIEFMNNVRFDGFWDFNAAPGEERDACIITGSKGSIRFAVFGKQEITISNNGHESKISFEPLQHVQQPMIEKVVEFFLGKGANPCPPEEGYEVMKLIDSFTGKQ
jgi:predicted dehydrogenase